MKQIRFFDPKREYDFIGKFRISVVIAVALPLACLLVMAFTGLNWGIDFAGGTELQVKFSKPVSSEELRSTLEHLGFHKTQVQSYGALENNEMLLRVERLSAMNADEAAHIEQVLKTNLANELARAKPNQFAVLFNADMGDRVHIKMPLPTVADAANPAQLQTAIRAQKQLLGKTLEEKSGFHLRRTKAAEGQQADTSDAILQSEPVDGTITYTAQFMGISEKIGEGLGKQFGAIEIRKVEFVDSQVSKQLRTHGVLALFYSLLAMLIYIAIRFDLLFAPGAVLGLVHDTLGALAVFAFFRYEFDLPSVGALLTIVGYSICNTIVIYDRIRETVPNNPKKPLDDEQVRYLVNKAVNDTFSRTINTSLTVLFTTIALFIFGGGIIKSFALTLTVGIILGAFASTFIAPGIYLELRKRFGQKQLASVRTGPTREDKARGIV